MSIDLYRSSRCSTKTQFGVCCVMHRTVGETKSYGGVKPTGTRTRSSRSRGTDVGEDRSSGTGYRGARSGSSPDGEATPTPLFSGVRGLQRLLGAYAPGAGRARADDRGGLRRGVRPGGLAPPDDPRDGTQERYEATGDGRYPAASRRRPAANRREPAASRRGRVATHSTTVPGLAGGLALLRSDSCGGQALREVAAQLLHGASTA